MSVSAEREPYNDDAFEKMFQVVLGRPKKDYPAYMGGLMVASGVEYTLESPIDNTVLFGRLQEQEPGVGEDMVNAARKVFPAWSGTPMAERIAIFEKIYEMANQRRYELAAAVLLSSGMTRREAYDEVVSFLDILAEEINRAESFKGKPRGVWAVCSTYCSPLAAPAAYALVAMLAGNTTVVANDRFCPVPMYILYDICAKCGLPDGVFNLMFRP